MKLVGKLKKQVEETTSKEEAKEIIENAGMLLTDDELDNVTGGTDLYGKCRNGGDHEWEIIMDSVAGKLVRHCSKCDTTLDIVVTSI